MATFSTSAQTVISDSFGRKAPGTRLNGARTELSGALWAVNEDNAELVFAANGGVTSAGATGGKAVATIPFSPKGNYAFAVSADIAPGGSDWAALAVGGSGDYFWEQAQPVKIAVILRGSRNAALAGQCTVFVNGMEREFKTVLPGEYGYSAGRPVRVRLVLDRAKRSFSVMLNDHKAVDGENMPESLFAPTPERVGFMVNRPDLKTLIIRQFKVELLAGEFQKVKEAEETAATGPEVLVLDAGAVSGTNMNRAGLNNGGGSTAMLDVQQSYDLAQPYFADFKFNVEQSGDYDIWSLVLGCNENWLSDFAWSVDGGTPARAVALPGSGSGIPRWLKLGSASFTQGRHALRFELTSRRKTPDDGWVFRLWKVALSPAGFSIRPTADRITLSYDPQATRGQENGTAETPAAGQKIRQTDVWGEHTAPVLLSVNPSRPGEIPPEIWRDYAEGGVLPDEDFFIPRLIQPLRPRFIRKDHCLGGYAVNKDADGKLTFDFSQGIMTIKAIRKVNAEPIVGLDTIPEALVKNIDGHEFLPKHLWATNATFRRDWGLTVENFVKTLQEEQLGVRYFQCFNEPDFTGFNHEPAAAVAVFDEAAKAVKRADPNAKIAGIGCGDGVNSVWTSFLDYLGKNPGRVDIFDFHQYQTSPERLKSTVAGLRAELKRRGAEKTEIALTEWGVSSNGAPHFRTGMNAVLYNADFLRGMLEAKVNIGGLFCMRDLPQEDYDWGLITVDGLLKPSYWGQWLWAQLPSGAPRLAVGGEDAMIRAVAFGRTNDVTLLLWNRAHENSANRRVFIEFEAQWSKYELTQFILDASRHIGFVPEGAPVEFPATRSSNQTGSRLEMIMAPQSMRLIRIQAQ